MDTTQTNWYVTRKFYGVTYVIEFVRPDGWIEWAPLETVAHIAMFTYEEACELAEYGLNTQVEQLED